MTPPKPLLNHPLLDPKFSRFIVVVPSSCWMWGGGTSGFGYGRFWHNGRSVAAHRHSYEMVNGPIPVGLQIDHLCREHGCVNPAHMEAVTPKVNTLRGIGLAAKNAVKTHCLRGHPLSEAYYRADVDQRQCRKCCAVRSRGYGYRDRKTWQREYRARRRQEGRPIG